MSEFNSVLIDARCCWVGFVIKMIHYLLSPGLILAESIVVANNIIDWFSIVMMINIVSSAVTVGVIFMSHTSLALIPINVLKATTPIYYLALWLTVTDAEIANIPFALFTMMKIEVVLFGIVFVSSGLFYYYYIELIPYNIRFNSESFFKTKPVSVASIIFTFNQNNFEVGWGQYKWISAKPNQDNIDQINQVNIDRINQANSVNVNNFINVRPSAPNPANDLGNPANDLGNPAINPIVGEPDIDNIEPGAAQLAVKVSFQREGEPN